MRGTRSRRKLGRNPREESLATRIGDRVQKPAGNLGGALHARNKIEKEVKLEIIDDARINKHKVQEEVI